MDDKEQQLRKELADLETKLQDPAVYSDKNYPKLARRKTNLKQLLIYLIQKLA